MFSSLYDPKSHKYATYYFAVLLSVSIAVIAVNINLVTLSPVEKGPLIFEGYFSLFMLVRHEKVGNAFLSHLSLLKELFKRHLFSSQL